MAAEKGRQEQRARAALEQAFVELVRAHGYSAVTVGGITERANVGRTTFYRYYQGKADLFLSVHAQRFRQMGIAPTTAAEWLADEPPAALVAFLESAQAQGRMMTLLGQLGAEVDIIQRRMGEALARHFAGSVRSAFPAQPSSIPLEVLGAGLAGTFMWVMQAGITSGDPSGQAAYLHYLLRAQVTAVLKISLT